MGGGQTPQAAFLNDEIAEMNEGQMAMRL